MPPSLQTGPNQGYLANRNAKHSEQQEKIKAFGFKAPDKTANNQRRINAAAALAQPFPTRPTRSTSTSSLLRRPAAAPLTRVPSAPTLLTPSTNKSILRKTGNAFVGATEATVNGLGTAVNGLGTAAKVTGNALGTATKATGQFVGNVASKLKFWGGKTRRNRRAHKKTRSRRYL